MKKSILFILIFLVIGLVLGYLIFGRISGEYVNISAIFSQSENVLESIGRNIAGLEQMRQNILISGGVGAVLGLILFLFRRK
ncbi:MAG: hypothetical protein JXR50_10115 [Prolixibacteraceae bacterium]|nr:hypothetical protein [Prolixibacteraceae bacterium]MBN2650081.1 hypothetical protein [Prolixibacteraceae bacterium]